MPDEPEDQEGPENLDRPPSFFRFGQEDDQREETSYGDPVQVSVEGVFQAESGTAITRFVLLSDGSRKLPIMIGPFEAQSITMAVEGERSDRPISHDLIRTLIERFNAAVERIVIDDLWNSVYYAKLVLSTERGEEEIDCRPSDAIALALRCDAPIFVLEGILDTGIGE